MHRFKEILPNKRKRKWWRIKLWQLKRLLGALHNEWKRIKGYKDEYPEENKGQCQSSLKEFYSRYKDQGI